MTDESLPDKITDATGRPRFQAYIERPTGKYRSSRPLTVQEYRNL